MADIAPVRNQLYRVHRRSDFDPGDSHYRFAFMAQEWISLHESETTAKVAARWARIEPVLAGFTEPWEILEEIDEASFDMKDELLAALIRLAQRGHQLAARTVLQALLPALNTMLSSLHTATRRACDMSGERTSKNDPDIEHFVVSECWLLIMGYSLDLRPSRIAANLVLDTRKRSMMEPRAFAPELVSLDFDDVFVADIDIADEVVERSTASVADVFSRDFELCIDWAVANNFLTADDGELLADVYADARPNRPMMHGPLPYHAKPRNVIYLGLAAQHDITYTAVVKRVSRARNQLVAALKHDLLAGIEAPSQVEALNFCIS